MIERKNGQKNIIVVSSADDGEILLDYDLKMGETLWTVTENAVPGDRVWFYTNAPVSAIVATGIVATETTYQNEAYLPWAYHHVAKIRQLEIIKFAPMKTLQKAFHQWRGFKDFEDNFVIEDNLVNFFLEVLEVDHVNNN